MEKNIISMNDYKEKHVFWWTYSVQSQMNLCVSESYRNISHISWHNGHRARIENLSKFTNVLYCVHTVKSDQTNPSIRVVTPRVEFVFVLNQSFLTQFFFIYSQWEVMNKELNSYSLDFLLVFVSTWLERDYWLICPDQSLIITIPAQ